MCKCHFYPNPYLLVQAGLMYTTQPRTVVQNLPHLKVPLFLAEHSYTPVPNTFHGNNAGKQLLYNLFTFINVSQGQSKAKRKEICV